MTTCNLISYVPRPFLGRNPPGPWPLWFDSCKRPNPISDHSVFAFWLVAYGKFECRSKMMSTIGMCKREPTFDFGCGHLGFSSAAKILGTRIHCCSMEAMIIEIEEKMVKFVGKTSCKWTILLNYQFTGVAANHWNVDHVLRCV